LRERIRSIYHKKKRKDGKPLHPLKEKEMATGKKKEIDEAKKGGGRGESLMKKGRFRKREGDLRWGKDSHGRGARGGKPPGKGCATNCKRKGEKKPERKRRRRSLRSVVGRKEKERRSPFPFAMVKKGRKRNRWKNF